MSVRISPAALAALLQGWGAEPGPLYQRLAEALLQAIRDGRLPDGAVLPPERHIAEALAISRSTVVAALESLKRSGQLQARQGSGTWVRAPRRLPDEGNRELVEELEGHAIIRDLSGAPVQPIELTAAAVDCAPAVLEASTDVDPLLLARWSRGHGYSPQGLEPLRAAVAERLTALGLPTGPEQVLITTGATQAILLAARLYLEPGAPVVMETPSYAGAIDVLHAAGARPLPIDVDASGARVDQLADHLGRILPRLVYLVPDYQNPTGAVMSQARRREVARLAAEYHVPIVEDLVQRDLWFDAPPPPPIAAADPDAPVLTLGSLSKVFWGGLRIGWARGNETTIARLARMKAVTDFGTPVLPQIVAAQLMPRFDEVAEQRRAELRERLEVLSAALARHLPSWRWARPAGGLSVWAKLPAPRADELANRALAHGMAVVPGTTFAVGEQRHADRIRLPFVADPETLEVALQRLAAAWSELEDRVAHPAVQALVV
jgi:DNA-binding transcriptional MocR family regulator